MKKHSGLVFFSIFIFFLMTGCAKIGSDEMSVSLEYAPDFTLRNTLGEKVSLSDYKGKDNVLLVFWTTWCPYCRSALNQLNNSREELREMGVVALPVNIAEPLAKVIRFKEALNLVFDVLLDEDAEVASNYEVLGVPTYFLINKEGRVIFNGTRLSVARVKSLLEV